MLVLNGSEHARDNAIFSRPAASTFGIIESSDCEKKKKKLNASNIEFLKSLGFAVRNV